MITKTLSLSAYKRYLRDPSSQGEDVLNKYVPNDSTRVAVVVGNEGSWKEITEPLEADGPLSKCRKIGGFSNASIVDVNPHLPAKPEPGRSYQIGWQHLAGVAVGGFSFAGNFIGPGANVTYFARPNGLANLIAKIHDFAYEINGLGFSGQKRPPAVWSRLAKADWIFVQMVEAAREVILGSLPIQLFAEIAFRAVPGAFRSGDGFINPIAAMPKDWLLTPPDYLLDPPELVIQQPRVNRPGRTRSRAINDPYLETPQDEPDFWMELIGSMIEPDFVRALERIGSDSPINPNAAVLGSTETWPTLGENAWSEPMTFRRFLEDG